MQNLKKIVSTAVVGIVLAVMVQTAGANPQNPPRVPVRVVQVGSPQNEVYTNKSNFYFNGTLVSGPAWGASSIFHLQVISNKGASDLYGYGRPHESFGGIQSYGPSGHGPWPYPDAGTWNPGEGTGFADFNGAYVISNPSVNGTDDGNALWFTIEQQWHVWDAPGTAFAIPAGTLPAGQTAFHLNNHHLAYRRAYCTRDVQ